MPKHQKRFKSEKQRVLARYMAIRLLSQLVDDWEVIEALERQFNVSDTVAKTLVREAWAEIVSADDGLDLRRRKGIMFMAAREHFRRCNEKGDLAQATASLRLIARIWGLDKPQEERDQLPSEQTKDEFSGRSASELRYYEQHGCWPADALPPPKGNKPQDPLAGLH
jgi:hypothetical protein